MHENTNCSWRVNNERMVIDVTLTDSNDDDNGTNDASKLGLMCDDRVVYWWVQFETNRSSNNSSYQRPARPMKIGTYTVKNVQTIKSGCQISNRTDTTYQYIARSGNKSSNM